MQTDIANIIEKAIANKHLAGAILQVNKKGAPLLQEAFGIQSFDEKINAGRLIEVVAILPLILKLVERRRSKLALNHKLSLYFPEFAQEGKENLQIMNLLTHTSGLSPKNFTQPLIFQPGAKVEYNAENFKLLPAVFEVVTGYSFHSFYQDRILDLLLMQETELTENYQLLTTVSDLSRYATMIEQDGSYDFIKIINKRAVQLSKQNFTSFLNDNRGLGWSIQNDTSDYPLNYSKEAYGYLDGLTTSLWFEPKKALNIVLHLTPFSEGEEKHLAEIRQDILSVIGRQG